jgi:8-oxo-dGTP diphosphatase
VGTPKVILVACAILEDGAGSVLVAQRPAHKHLGLKWEFPGGKVESGESPSVALVRELREELGCDAAVICGLPPFRHDYGDVHIEMFPFVCRLTPASPAPYAHEHVALRWLRPAELSTLDLAAADLPVVASYVRDHKPSSDGR